MALQPSKWFVGVTAVDRDPPTLPGTLESLAEAGWDEVKVFFDWKQQGPMATFKWAISSLTGDAMKQVSGSVEDAIAHADELLLNSWLAVFQDDVEVAAGLRGYMAPTVAFSKPAVWSPYMPSHLHRDEQKKHSWRIVDLKKKPSSHGALSLLMPVSVAVKMLGGLPNPTVDPKYAKQVDFWVTRWCREQGISYHAHQPSLAKHTGTTSTLGDPGGVDASRQAKCWQPAVQIPDRIEQLQ